MTRITEARVGEHIPSQLVLDCFSNSALDNPAHSRYAPPPSHKQSTDSLHRPSDNDQHPFLSNNPHNNIQRFRRQIIANTLQQLTSCSCDSPQDLPIHEAQGLKNILHAVECFKLEKGAGDCKTQKLGRSLGKVQELDCLWDLLWPHESGGNVVTGPADCNAQRNDHREPVDVRVRTVLIDGVYRSSACHKEDTRAEVLGYSVACPQKDIPASEDSSHVDANEGDEAHCRVGSGLAVDEEVVEGDVVHCHEQRGTGA